MDQDGVQVELFTGVCAGILRLSIRMGNQFSTDNLAMVSSVQSESFQMQTPINFNTGPGMKN